MRVCVSLSNAGFRSNFLHFSFNFFLLYCLGSDRGLFLGKFRSFYCIVFSVWLWERGGQSGIRKRMFVVFLVSWLVFVCLFVCERVSVYVCFVYGYLHFFNTPFASTTSASSIQLVNNFKKHILLNTFIIHVICVEWARVCVSRGMWIANNMFNSFFFFFTAASSYCSRA